MQNRISIPFIDCGSFCAGTTFGGRDGFLFMSFKETPTITHGATCGRSPTRSYISWKHMKQRCLNPKSKFFKDYGGRGISICEKWMSYEGFLDDMGNRPKGLSLGRIDNDGNYCKENCRWETIKQQQRNRRSSHFLTIGGVSKTVIEWAEQNGFNPKSIYTRLHQGCSLDHLFDPVNLTPGC